MFKTPSTPSTFKLFEENFRKDPSEVVYGGKVNTGMDGPPCFFDSLPESEKGKPMLVNCPCRKCSPWC